VLVNWLASLVSGVMSSEFTAYVLQAMLIRNACVRMVIFFVLVIGYVGGQDLCVGLDVDGGVVRAGEEERGRRWLEGGK
jgi:hypothetical protein